MTSRTLKWVWVGLLLASLPGCRQRSIGAPPDDGGTPTPDGGGGGACVLSFSVEALDSAAVGWDSAEVAVARDRIVYTAVQEAGPGEEANSEVFRLQVSTGIHEQLSDDPAASHIVDALGDRVFLASRGEPGTMALWLRRGGLDESIGQWPTELPPDLSEWGFIGGRQLLTEQHAVWSGDGVIYLYDGDQVVVLFDDPEWRAWSPAIADDQVVFVANREGQTEIFSQRLGGSLARLTDDDDWDSSPVVGAGAVSWVCAGQLCRYTEATGVELLDTGSCFSPAADGEELAWISDGRVRQLRGGEIVSVHDDPERPAQVVRLRAERLVWVEMGTDQEWDYVGTVVYSDGTRRLELSGIRLPHIAGHIDTVPALDYSDHLVAWCDSVEPDWGGDLRPCYYARITETGDCGRP